MNNLHLIMDKIASDAESEAAKIVADAENAAGRIRRETMEEAEAILSRSLSESHDVGMKAGERRLVGLVGEGDAIWRGDSISADGGELVVMVGRG
jgi:hypothetical protein